MSEKRPLSRAAIVAVGSELLTPEHIDTNSLFLTRELNELGIRVRHKTIVGDVRDDLASVLQDAIPHADLLVVTGGLGGTDDDITRETVASVFKCPLDADPEVVRAIRFHLEARGLQMTEREHRQALVPRGAKVLPNEKGTAPGLWMEQPETVCLVLPGPPRELGPMFKTVAQERIAPRSGGRRILRRVLRVAGRTESQVEAVAQPVYSRWRSRSQTIDTSILAALGQIELHLSIRSGSTDDAVRALDIATAELVEVLSMNLVSSDGSRLEEVVGRELSRRGYRVAVAESCTGGLVTSRLTDVPGSSVYVQAGWIVYSNVAKTNLLGVAGDVIDTHGAVSEVVAEAMAVGARQRADVEYGLGITGIAGPGGGSVEKPVGTVCIALSGHHQVTRVRRFHFTGERERVKFQASQAALDMLRRALLH